MRPDKFHGRYDNAGRPCAAPGCGEAGEFRAPGEHAPSFDGPGEWRWLCLEHVREFNAGYDWFEGMTPDEILAAQSPIAGWRNETRAFRADAGVDGVPRWADFDDPLEAIGARASDIRARAAGRRQMSRFTPKEREALEAMGLGPETDLHGLRKRYSTLVSRYHPDRNGGDRSHDRQLAEVIGAWQKLKVARAFA